MGIICIHCIGVNKDAYIKKEIEEYAKKTQNILNLKWCYYKSAEKLAAQLNKEKIENIYLLAERGELMDSHSFSKFIFNKQKSRYCFVLGENTGFTSKICEMSKKSISLSKMTFTYQHARLIFAEQIYRACQIYQNTAYHK